MEATRLKKLRRDEMYVNKAMKSIKELKRKLDEELCDVTRELNNDSNENNITPVDPPNNEPSSARNYTTEDLTCGIDIPSREPILLTNNPKFQETAIKKLLSKGPSFVPTPSSADWDQFHQDYERFCNGVRREIFFHNSVQISDEQSTDVPRKPSNWKAPRSNIPEAEIFLKQIEKDLFADVQPKKIEQNLSKEERAALQECRKMLNNPESQQVIRMQDKGNKFVIVDRETDILKSEQQILKSSMEPLTDDPTKQITQRVERWCKKWKDAGHLSSDWMKYIVNPDATAARNTPLYKTHKAGTPVRLLTSGCNSATEGISQYIEIKCAPLAKNMKSRIRDTGHMLDIIDELNESGIPENAALVSLDIENMFPSIDNGRGMETIRKRLDREEEFSLPTEHIIEALEIILTNNNSKFNGTNYLQKNGTATGAKNSCSYSDMALEPIDDEIFNAKTTTFKEIHSYFRYRDDCFLLWLGNKDLLNKFVYFVNILDPSLKFTVEYGGKSLKFLDLLITLDNGKLNTTVYSKPTDGHLYLNNASCHPKNTKRAVQHGTALRLRRICSTDAEFESKSKDYQAYLASCGHNPNEIVEKFNAVKNISRQEARTKNVPQNQPKKHRFITKFNPRHPNVRNIIAKHEHLLRTSATLDQIFPEGSFQVVNKRERNLKELVSRADPYSSRPHHIGQYKKCDRTCDSCKSFVTGDTDFKCNATGRNFRLQKDINCNTPNVVYLCECRKCKEQGVGSTVIWKPRIRNYKSHVKHGIRQCRVGNHFIDNAGCRGPDDNPWENMKFTIIDCVDNFENLTPEQIDEELLKKEKMWIRKLVTYHHGMNSSHDLNRSRRNEREKLD